MKICEACQGTGEITIADGFGVPVDHVCQKCKGQGLI